ncbi:MAG: hypothetical protein KDA81_09605, partial [Planctomycetaceae bacterium]|nr:hypothetical protein [Planctomycetaceae bacterium]
MELSSDGMQQQVAGSVLQQRIDDLMREVKTRLDNDLERLSGKRTSGGITEAKFRQQKSRLTRQLNQRVARYRHFRSHTDEFQTFVDMFQNPDVWHGHLVTLRGHVRHVVSYPGDPILFGGRMLHELWLFTDDSQHNPAVIITPHLPADFPTSADVIDRVAVTGCFFKRYVYGSQDSDRIAPLILAGNIRWEPTVDQVQSLVASGHLSAGSPRAVRARSLAGRGLGESAIVLVTFMVILVIMVLWGRALREERDRVRLRKHISDAQPFENPQPVGYSLPAFDFVDDRSFRT